MLRKCLFIAFSFFISFSVFSKTGDDIYKEFSKKKGVTSVNLGKIGMGLVKSSIKMSVDDDKSIKDIKSVKMLTFEECSKEDIKSLKKSIDKLKDSGYELFLKQDGDDGQSLIYMKTEKEKLSEMIIATFSDEPALVIIKGKINIE
jgi:hypothetical protein